MQNPIMVNYHTKSCLIPSVTKRGNILRLSLRYNSTSRNFFSVYGVVVEDTNTATKQLDNALSKKWYKEYSETCGYLW